MSQITPVSKKIAAMAPSATLAMTQRARDLAAQGIDIISLSAGEPDFDTPDHIKQAAKDAITAGHTKYTAVDGISELKSAICEKFKRDNGLSYELAQVNVSPGGKAVIFNALAASLEPGDEVIIPAPCWVSYPEMVSLLGGYPKIVSCPAAQGFKLSAEQLAKTLNRKSKWLILNSPGNPSGALYNEAELRALGDVIAAHNGLLVLTDEIYEHLSYGHEFVSFAKANPELKDRTLTMNGVSKAYAMTGWRIGFAAGPENLVRGMAKVMGQSTSNPSSISQWAAVAALKGDQSFLGQRREVFRKRRDFVVDRLREMPGVECATPDGAFYVFADISNCLGKNTASKNVLNSDIDLANAVLNEAHVAVVPGTAFHAPGHMRLSYATDDRSLDQAMGRLAEFFKGLS